MIKDCTIATIHDPADQVLNQFRQDIFQNDLGLDPQLISVKESHKWWIENYNEDAYKYSDSKWFDIGFNAIEVAFEDGKVVSMSGSKVYADTTGNKFLRVNMFYYILKAYRGKYNGIVYIDQGFFDRQIMFAKATRCQGLFFTIYAYSSKLRAMVLNHTTRRISHVRSKLKHWDDLQHMGQHQFNDVPQDFFYYPFFKTKFEPWHLIT
jgi:hypothetical protein